MGRLSYRCILSGLSIGVAIVQLRSRHIWHSSRKMAGSIYDSQASGVMKVIDREAHNIELKSISAEKRSVDIPEENQNSMDFVLRENCGQDGYVVLTAANYAFRDHLVNFWCTIRQLAGEGNPNVAIAAMDKKIFEWGLQREMPIFLAKAAFSDENAGGSLVYRSSSQMRKGRQADELSQDGYNNVTKMKSQVVSDVLEAGFSVIFSDADVTWFSHPFEALQPFMHKEVMAIQSDAPLNNGTKRFVKVFRGFPDNKPASQTLNSGLYVVPSTPVSRQAFRDIVSDTAESITSEQPSFRKVLCDRSPSEFNKTVCIYRTVTTTDEDNDTDSIRNSLPVVTLDRHQFAHGAVSTGPTNQHVFRLGKERFETATGKRLYAAHNNWVVGIDRKIDRVRKLGWWHEQNENLECITIGS